VAFRPEHQIATDKRIPKTTRESDEVLQQQMKIPVDFVIIYDNLCTVKGKEVIIRHSFIKKSQKTPKNEMKIARNRLKRKP
jgi:hypothetical protein